MTRLTYEDPTVFARCEACAKRGKGSRTSQYFGKAYPPRKFKRDPKCDNCGGPMTEIYRVEIK